MADGGQQIWRMADQADLADQADGGSGGWRMADGGGGISGSGGWKVMEAVVQAQQLSDSPWRNLIAVCLAEDGACLWGVRGL